MLFQMIETFDIKLEGAILHTPHTHTLLMHHHARQIQKQDTQCPLDGMNGKICMRNHNMWVNSVHT